MSEHYDFHYQPTGSGAISGQQVLEQTEDAINELGDYVNDNVGGAMDVAQEALETAQNAQNDAQTALDTANSFSSAIQSAQQDANTALSTAQTAQTTASNANNTAIQASQDASSAVTTANNASGQVSTLSGTVTALGQRVTTAEGNIGQNTSDITALTTRVGTAEGNITTLQNDVSIAQGNASSAMATAGTVKQQSYVLRYSSTTLTASSTNSNSLLDNTDNLKVGDKVIDNTGNIYVVTAIDTANSTFTIGTSLIDLAQDSDVVHKSGDEAISGFKTFSSSLKLTAYPSIRMNISDDEWDVLPQITKQSEIRFTDKNSVTVSYFVFQHRTDSNEPFRTCWRQQKLDGTSGYHGIAFNNLGDFYPENNNTINLGGSGNRWKSVYATNYYYGSNNVEFSNKFVTTDTAQTVSGSKTFSSDLNISNTDTTANTPNLSLRNYKADRGTTETGVQTISFSDKNAKALTVLESRRTSNGNTGTNILCYNTDDSNNTVSGGVTIIKGKTYTNFAPSTDNAVTCGRPLAKWSGVYSTEYYYGANNTPFTDKFVTTDTAQTVSGQKIFNDINTISSSSEIGVSGGNKSFKILDKNNKILARIEGGTYSSGMAYSYWLVNNGADAFNGVSLYQASANLVQLRPNSSTLNVQLGVSSRYFTDCYTSKVNGLEPSSLSLPSGNANDVIDISSYITSLDGTSNSYTVPANGWISIAVVGTAIDIVSSSWSDSRLRASSGNVRMLYPVLKNETLAISVTGTTLTYARFIPCQGNV